MSTANFGSIGLRKGLSKKQILDRIRRKRLRQGVGVSVGVSVGVEVGVLEGARVGVSVGVEVGGGVGVGVGGGRRIGPITPWAPGSHAAQQSRPGRVNVRLNRYLVALTRLCGMGLSGRPGAERYWDRGGVVGQAGGKPPAVGFDEPPRAASTVDSRHYSPPPTM